MTSTHFDLRTTKEYRELGFKIVTCPVCGKETLDNYFICPTCGWNTTASQKRTNIHPATRRPLQIIAKTIFNIWR